MPCLAYEPSWVVATLRHGIEVKCVGVKPSPRWDRKRGVGGRISILAMDRSQDFFLALYEMSARPGNCGMLSRNLS